MRRNLPALLPTPLYNVFFNLSMGPYSYMGLRATRLALLTLGVPTEALATGTYQLVDLSMAPIDLAAHVELARADRPRVHLVPWVADHLFQSQHPKLELIPDGGPPIIFGEPGFYAILGATAGGKSTIAKMIANMFRLPLVLVGEPVPGALPGLAPAMSGLFNRLALMNGGEGVVIDSLYALSVYGDSLGSGGVPRTLYTTMAELDRLASSLGIFIFGVINPLIDAERLGAIATPTLGASRGLIEIVSAPQFNSQVVKARISVSKRPERAAVRANLSLDRREFDETHAAALSIAELRSNVDFFFT